MIGTPNRRGVRLRLLLSAASLIATGIAMAGRPASAQTLSAATAPAPVVTDLTAGTGRGFGSSWNRYSWSMASFQGDLYVGTWNAQFSYLKLFQDILSGRINLNMLSDPRFNPLSLITEVSSTGGEIWRMSAKTPGQWQRVFKATPYHTGFRKLTEFNGRLYGGTENITTGAAVYRSADGSSWSQVPGGPQANAHNSSIRAMTVFNGKLYIGTENDATGGELWSLNAKDQWTQEALFPNDTSAAEILAFGGKLYVGTWDFRDSYSLFRIDGTRSTTNVTPVDPQLRRLANLGVMSLIEFQGELYLGTVNYLQGFTLLRSATPDNPLSWEIITMDGLHSQVPAVRNADNAYAWSMVEQNGVLYLGTFNHGVTSVLNMASPPFSGSAQLLRSTDGLHWDVVIGNGFGSPYTYGIRTMVPAPNGKLYVGTASNIFVPDLLSSLYRSPQSQQVLRRLSSARLERLPVSGALGATPGLQLYNTLLGLKPATRGSNVTPPSRPTIGLQIFELDFGSLQPGSPQ